MSLAEEDEYQGRLEDHRHHLQPAHEEERSLPHLCCLPKPGGLAYDVLKVLHGSRGP